MTFLSRAALTGVLMFFSAHAVSFVGEMISGNIVWKDASQTQESTVASRWINASPEWVTRWQPSVPSFTSQTLHLTQNGGSDSVSIPVEILGIQYNTPISGADPGFFPGAALISSGNTLKKNGTTKDGLFALNTVSYSRNQVPFTGIKPMISGLSSDALKLAFRGKQSGVYEGNIAFSLPMIYRRLTDEPVTYKGMTFTQTVRIVLRNATCTSAQWRKKQVVNLGDMTQRELDNKTMNSTRVPFTLQCDNPVSVGLINFKGVDANIPGKSVILADARDDIGVALTPAKGNFLPKIDLNNPVDYTKVFSGTAPNYDFSFYATPFAISKSVAKGKYTARLIIDVTYQ